MKIRTWWRERVGFRKTLLRELQSAHETGDELLAMHQWASEKRADAERALKDAKLKLEAAEVVLKVLRSEKDMLERDLQSLRDRLIEFRNAKSEEAAA